MLSGIKLGKKEARDGGGRAKRTCCHLNLNLNLNTQKRPPVASSSTTHPWESPPTISILPSNFVNLASGDTSAFTLENRLVLPLDALERRGRIATQQDPAIFLLGNGDNPVVLLNAQPAAGSKRFMTIRRLAAENVTIPA
jgi:hypothetical protein